VVRQDPDEGYAGGDIEYAAAERHAYERVPEGYLERYHEGSHDRGVPVELIESEEDARASEDDPWVENMAVAEGVLTDD
jgi:nitric oxide reductase subunit B